MFFCMGTGAKAQVTLNEFEKIAEKIRARTRKSTATKASNTNKQPNPKPTKNTTRTKAGSYLLGKTEVKIQQGG